ncbi:hypothetical protein RHSIM_Rhsim10G0185100 [Rhododendron simsii]|uniref:Uncharacterized protein n=1 Tax=Rhododendron simsii TaxID=118357 RepID=A0A834GEN0_RHOSS|nr:hypothetical protein RHSIM_Rhsim10G0185100 [Rhododendron simsii]
MVSAAVDLQDQSGGSTSSGVLPTVNDYALKVRKPYTITKQRERWTEEEHDKFIEALKLYGRLWRRIEEHVATKTAVQIRSHAQKFFCKVVRQSSNADASPVKPIEIPPPRPKRKPAHPYPRKLVAPVRTGTSVLKQQTRSTSPNSYVSDQENQSPTSVLSAIGSEMMGTMDSNTPNGSLSPVSSADGFLGCEPNSSPEEAGSLLQINTSTSSSPDEETPMNLEVFPEVKAISEDESAEAGGSTRSFKLFGKNVLVTDSNKPSEAFYESPPPSDVSDGKHVHSLPWGFSDMSMEEGKWNPPSGLPAAFYYMQFPNENRNPADGVSIPPLPWWAFHGNLPFASFPLHNPVPTKECPSFVCAQTRYREVQNEGSRTGSNTGSENAGGDGDRNWEVETQSRLVSSEKEENVQQSKLQDKNSENLSFSEQRMALDKCLKGFVPYKRCVAERDTQSSTTACDEREEQRIQLYL